MKVGIIGLGFVGKALQNGLTDQVEVLGIDPKIGTEVIDLVSFQPNFIFICVPTPMNNDFSQDLKILNDVLKKISSYELSCPLILKSTVLPEHLIEIEKSFPNIIFNPEFLREKHAEEDFIKSDMIIFGGNNDYSRKVSDFFKKYTLCECEDHTFTDLISASLIKYSINSFLATKVIFFNELYRVFELSGTTKSWSSFIKIINEDSRIGSSHMDVPGHDGRFGFGGACFPKDSNALVTYAKSKGIDMHLLNTAININNIIRAQYNAPTTREIEQNIDFKIKKS